METYSDISGILFSISVPRMEADQIRMKMDSDILNIYFFSFQFPFLRMETNRICIETDSDISNIRFPISSPFTFLGVDVSVFS